MNKIQSTSLFVILALTLTMSAITPNLANAQQMRYESHSTENQIDVNLIGEYKKLNIQKSQKLVLFKLPLEDDTKTQLKKALSQDNQRLSEIRAELRGIGVYDVDTFTENPEFTLQSIYEMVKLEHIPRLEINDEPTSCNEECRTMVFKIGYYYTCFDEFICTTFAVNNIGVYVGTEKDQRISIVIEDPLEITPFHIVYSEYDNRSAAYSTYLELTSTHDPEYPYSTTNSNQEVNLDDGFDIQVVIDNKKQFVAVGESTMLMSFNIQKITLR